MNEIPLLRGSRIYRQRLCEAAERFADSRYQFARRVNWSHKYAETYYRKECAAFVGQPDEYLQNTLPELSELEDIFHTRMTSSAASRIFIKTILHRVFGWVGYFQRVFWRKDRGPTYRKAYVDDIELAFDDANATDRFVYPFPISATRQLKYVYWLIRTKRRFCLAGHDYLFADIFRFLRTRSIGSLLRLERRAQILHAQRIFALGYHKFEVSDEFDLGSLEFCRMANRIGVETENSAHGVGTYLPFHKYRAFQAITNRQIEYYRSIGPCVYAHRYLSLRENSAEPDLVSKGEPRCSVVFVSQVFSGVSSMVSEAESELLPVLSTMFRNAAHVTLFYRAHPNQHETLRPDGFIRSSEFSDYGPENSVIFLSLFSTIHIDPNFRGDSYLVQTKYIRPEIVFDKDEKILPISELPNRLARIVEGKIATNDPRDQLRCSR